MPIPADLDHVAVATEHTSQAWPRYAGDLGGVWQGGGETAGFYSAQVAYANGMKVEALHPVRVEENDFLRRYLDHTGPSAHHLTFKVPDLHEAIEMASDAGIPPINVNLSDPGWQEAFLHPKQSCGIVVQLAHAGDGGSWVPEPQPNGFPLARVSPATFVRIVHLVADLAEGRRLFEGLLGGTVEAEGDDATGRFVDVAWPGPGRVRLVVPTDEAAIAELGGRPGRLHHLAFSVTAPANLPGARRTSEGVWTIDPADNLGVRLVITEA